MQDRMSSPGYPLVLSNFRVDECLLFFCVARPLRGKPNTALPMSVNTKNSFETHFSSQSYRNGTLTPSCTTRDSLNRSTQNRKSQTHQQHDEVFIVHQYRQKLDQKDPKMISLSYTSFFDSCLDGNVVNWRRRQLLT